MIELEEQLNCSQNHKQPIMTVLFDKNLKREERLLCAICMQNFESSTKIIGFKRVLQMIQENLESKVENIQKLIKHDVDLVESFLDELHKLKSKVIQQLDELISNSNEWIKSLNDIGQLNPKYSFFDELEMLINSQSNQKSIIDQVKILNDSLSTKINMKLYALSNKELYSQCSKKLINFMIPTTKLIENKIKQSPMKEPLMKLIDNQIKQDDFCSAISFNQSGSLMISASNRDIKVWNFAEGKMNEITKISGHTKEICCLQFSKNSNSFVSAGSDKSIRCWKQINQQEWKSSLSYQQHTNKINCIALNQFENQLVSGGSDNSIKIWIIDFVNNQLTYLYSLDKHTSYVCSICFNQSEDTLVSCGGDKFIIIWKKDNQQKWQFGYVVTQKVQDSGCRLYFINDNQFIWVTGIQVSKDCISTFELKNEKYQENLQKEVELIKNDKDSDLTYFPIFYAKKKNLMIVKHKCYVYLIKISNEGLLKIITQIKFESNSIQGALSNDGRYLVTWDRVGQKYHVYELFIN